MALRQDENETMLYNPHVSLTYICIRSANRQFKYQVSRFGPEAEFKFLRFAVLWE